MYCVALGDVCYGLNCVPKRYAELLGPSVWEHDLIRVSEDDQQSGFTPNMTGDEPVCLS